MEISKLHEQLQKIKKEIKKIQDKCSHKKQEIKFIKNFDIRWVCKKCDLPLGWPSKKESENWLNGK